MQITGRMRGQLADPVDPTIEPVVHMFCGVAIPRWEVDEVIGLDDLRERLGLAVQEKKRRGRSSAAPLEEQIRRRWAKHGPAATMRWLVKGYFGVTNNDADVTAARLAIERAGLDFKGGLVAVSNRVIAELLKNSGREQNWKAPV